MANTKPDFLPDVFYQIYTRMHSEGNVYDKRESFFFDYRLVDFWKQINLHNFNTDEAEIFTGCVFAPLGLFNSNETQDSPGFKIGIKTNLNEASKILEESESIAIDLMSKLNAVLELTAYHPDEIYLSGLMECLDLEDDLNITNLSSSSRYFKVTLADLLHCFISGVQRQPSSFEEFFPRLPGLHSQKSPAKDYIKQVRYNLELTFKNRSINLTNDHWDALLEVMTADNQIDHL